MGKRFAIVIGVAAAGVMALGTQTAAAGPDVVKYDTKLTLFAAAGPQYWGWVESAVRKCMEGRKVVLFKQRPGADRRLGKDRSFIYGADQHGQWLIIGLGGEGRRLYAKVMRKRRDGFVCRADRSPIFHP